eukprot:324856-Prorocentrum_minimum.AAC.2
MLEACSVGWCPRARLLGREHRKFFRVEGGASVAVPAGEQPPARRLTWMHRQQIPPMPEGGREVGPPLTNLRPVAKLSWSWYWSHYPSSSDGIRAGPRHLPRYARRSLALPLANFPIRTVEDTQANNTSP